MDPQYWFIKCKDSEEFLPGLMLGKLYHRLRTGQEGRSGSCMANTTYNCYTVVYMYQSKYHIPPPLSTWYFSLFCSKPIHTVYYSCTLFALIFHYFNINILISLSFHFLPFLFTFSQFFSFPFSHFPYKQHRPIFFLSPPSLAYSFTNTSSY